MLYYQITDDKNHLTPNWDHFFQSYNGNQNFDEAVANPGTAFRGTKLTSGNMLTTSQDLMLNRQETSSAIVVGMLTCTALAARCGANSEIYVCHVGSGFISDSIIQKLQQLKEKYPNEIPQAVYVVPKIEWLETYKDDVNKLVAQGYQTCLIGPKMGRDIGSVTVDVGGNFFIC